VCATGCRPRQSDLVDAVDNHRRRMANLLGNIEALDSTTLLAPLADQLRTSNDRLAELAAQLGEPLTPAQLTYTAMSVPSDTGTGDWYDVLELPAGEVAMIVGDAGGRGRRAEPMRHRLQQVTRDLALEGAGPGEILGEARAMVEPDIDGLATVVLAVLDPATDVLTIANAGHPPPVLVERDGTVRLLDGDPCPPLGAPTDRPDTPTTIARLRPADTVVAYTDGLIERPDIGMGIDEGLRRLVATAAFAATASLDELSARLIHLGLAQGRPVDDLTVLAARRGGPGRPGSPSTHARTNGRST
jgi:serine phosphatase RsbU (regulator of sigma subunit)